MVKIIILKNDVCFYKTVAYICIVKKNVILQSKDRHLFGVSVRQETKTGFLNISDLQEAYTRARIQNGWSDKKADDVLRTKENQERIYYVLKKQDLDITPHINGFIEECNKNGIAKTLKKIGAYKTTGARHTKTTWCNPYIWTLIALELNPMMYGEVVTWLTDKLILNRIEAGSFYLHLSKAISAFPDTDYQQIAKALNCIVFGRHETGIRNTGSESELKELRDLEAKLAWAIDMGFIKNQKQLLDEMRKIYNQKYPNPKLLT